MSYEAVGSGLHSVPREGASRSGSAAGRSGRHVVVAVTGLIRVAIAWVALGLVAGAVALIGAGAMSGYSALTVMSGSMAPAIGTGDVIVVRQISPRQAKVGEVVTFRSSERGGALLTHRLRSARTSGGVAHFVTQGDANNAVERWSIPSDGSMARVAYRVPGVGRVLGELRTRSVLLLIVPAALLAAFELVRIWWRPRRTPA